MEDVRNVILQKWGENIKQLNSESLSKLYLLYDKYAFYNQITNRAREMKYVKVFMQISDSKIHNLHYYGGVSRYETDDGFTNYNLKISPWVMSRINYTPTSNDSYLGISSKKTAFLMAFEHLLVQLIIELWEPSKAGPNYKDLFQCIYISFFQQQDIIKNLTSIKSYPQPEHFSKNVGGYKYWENSCYLDSLMTIIYLSKMPVIRDAIFTTDISIEPYNANNIKYICSKKSPYQTNMDYIKFVQKMQAIMFADYMDIISDNTIYCRGLRELLANCYIDMNNGKTGWQFYNVAEIYTLISASFQSLLHYKLPMVVTQDGYTYRQIEDSGSSTFMFWEFMEPQTEDSQAYNRIDWSKINYPILVFKNGGYPAITQFGSTEKEIVKIYDKKYEIEKGAAFGETILDEKYEIVGAIILDGTKPGQSGGTHYTSYVKTYAGWFFYNDIGSVWKKVTRFPGQIFTEVANFKPEMYFYQRIDNI